MIKKNLDLKIVKSTDKERNLIADKLVNYNRKILNITPEQYSKEINYIIKDGSSIVGGINAKIYFINVLYIIKLIIDEEYRGKDLGSTLLHKVEDEGRRLGATLAHLDTFDFQAKDFYLKHGYEIIGILDDCPEGYKRYYFKKIL